MKTRNNFVLLILILLLSTSACNLFDPDEDPPADNKHLISYEKITILPIGTAFLDILISAYPPFSDQVVQNFTAYNVNVYRIIYKTTYKGIEKRASGACIIPDTGDTPVPIASYQHGTIFSDAEAPSSFSNVSNMSVETGLNLVFSACGFIVSIPDYIGFNESGDVLHPYHHYESTSDACIDMLRAVRELCRELNIEYLDKTFLFGYSEGGYATLATLKKIQALYSNEISISACCAGAGAYDLAGTAQYYLSRSVLPSAAFVGFLFAAYNEVMGWNRPMSDLFRSPCSDRIANGLYNGSYNGGYINGQLTNQTDELFQSLFLNGFLGDGEQIVKNALLENCLYYGWYPEVPTRFYHGTDDSTVPAFNSANTDQAFRNSGATAVQYFPLGGMNHTTAIVPWVKEMIVWFKSL